MFLKEQSQFSSLKVTYPPVGVDLCDDSSLLNLQKAHFGVGTLESDCVPACYWTCFSNFIVTGDPVRGFGIDLTFILTI